MPVLRFRTERLLELVQGLSLEELRESLFRLKCETELDEEGYIHVEVYPDRPDMYSAEGIARAVRGLIGVDRGYIKPAVKTTDFVVQAEEVVSRRFIAAAIVWNVNVDEYYLEELIQLQEKLHETIGRGRRKVAIGLHDLSRVAGNKLTYRMEPVSIEFTPLGHERPMTLEEVLETTEQGIKYGHISRLGDRHPVLRAGGEVISVPPVINAESTRIEPGTKDVLIDVTGPELETVLRTMTILVTSMAERSDAVIGEIRVEGPWGAMRTPVLESKRLTVSSGSVSSILGVRLDAKGLADALSRARFNARPVEGDLVEVEIPPYRFDVMGVADIAEEAAMMLGYEELGPRLPAVPTRGGLEPITALGRKVRLILIGLGFTEVMQLTLTSPDAVEALGMSGSTVRVANPVQRDYSVLRPSLAVSLLGFLSLNQHREKPVKVFELGPVAYMENGDVVEDERLGIAVMDDSVSYEDIQAPVYSLLRLLGISFSVKEYNAEHLLEGRAAMLTDSKGEMIGWLGEINPEALLRSGVEYPVAMAELSLRRMLGERESFRIPGRRSRFN